jgi:hypothetical protein
VGDFNGDGTLDLAVANPNSSAAGSGNDSATVSILLGTGTGSFGAKTDFGTGRGSNSVAVGDFNGDGKLDLAVAGGSATVSILLGTGTGSFGAKTDFGTGGASSVAVGDFNGDGKLDLVAASGGDTVSILLGAGTGSFGAKTDFGTGSGPYSVAVGDFNGDGNLDLAVTNSGDSFAGEPIIDPRTVSILLGTGTGSFGAKTDFGTDSLPVSVAVGDFNGDGKLDLAVANLGSFFVSDPGPATVSILLNTGPTGPCASTNPIDCADFFVRQHYRDFLNRQADDLGLAFWTNEITSCGADVQCVEVKRINVSAAFYLSIEFQQTGYLVERLYKAAFSDVNRTSTFNGVHQLPVPVVRFSDFLPDTQRIGQGVVVGQGNWQQQLEDNKNAFTAEFVQRPQFATAFPTSMTPAEFVDKLFQNTGVSPSGTERNTAINEFSGAGDTSNLTARSKALRDVAENTILTTNEFNRAFVLMQYFGYLRRNPNDPQDTDYTGYDFWLTKLNSFTLPGDNVLVRVQNAEMVKAFITSSEYRQRFGP